MGKNRDEMKAAIESFLDGGGKITKLRYATEKDQIRSSRNWYHKDKAMSGSHRSQKIIESDKKKESAMIFSRDERWSEE